MKNKLILSIWLLAFCVIIACKVVMADTPKTPINADKLIGSWIGYEDSHLCFYRLLLESKNVGVCTILFNDGTADSYDVSWQTEGILLQLKLSPINTDAESMEAIVESIDYVGMKLLTKGVTNQWQRQVLIFKENTLVENTKKCVEEAKKKNSTRQP